MKAFLDGERQIVEGRWRTAPEAFERAFTEDTTFWLAYWRYAFARDYWSAASIRPSGRSTCSIGHNFPNGIAC